MLVWMRSLPYLMRRGGEVRRGEVWFMVMAENLFFYFIRKEYPGAYSCEDGSSLGYRMAGVLQLFKQIKMAADI
jgi:hypothetical protein